MVSKRLRLMTATLFLCSLTLFAADARAWFQYVQGGYEYGEEPGDQCSSMHWMCHDYCGGGDSDSYCNYTYGVDWMDGYCYCA
jgi:hypothetical protein